MKEFSQKLCFFYMAALAGLLPLYARGTYVMLGDDKYALFYSVSLICLGLGAAALFAEKLIGLARARHSDETGILSGKRSALEKLSNRYEFIKRGNFSPVDACMLLYGLAVIISALCSSYGTVAWSGYRDWHMGAVSQLIFVGIYFLVSRCYKNNIWFILLMEAAFFLVTLLGFCSRLGFDPLGLMHEFNSGDWEYSHLISTIGNINWFCGYCAVALAMPVAGYIRVKRRGKAAAFYVAVLYVICVLGLLILCIHGSDTGPVLAAVCLGVCLVWSRGRAIEFGRTLLLAAGIAFGLPCYSGLVRLVGQEALKSLPADGPGLQLFSWSGWWLVGMVCLGLYFLLYRLRRTAADGKREAKITVEGTDKAEQPDILPESTSILVRRLWLGILIFGTAVILAGGIFYLRFLLGSEAWVSGRGALWNLSLQGFLRGDWKQKLFGAGPDCFAEYIYSAFAPSELFETEGYWAGSVFANAHNQWLNHLVNMGLFGVGCAAAVAAASVRRYRGYLPGALVLAMYGVNSLVSFQQVLSTPLFFMMLGVCESLCRCRHFSRNFSSVGLSALSAAK